MLIEGTSCSKQLWTKSMDAKLEKTLQTFKHSFSIVATKIVDPATETSTRILANHITKNFAVNNLRDIINLSKFFPVRGTAFDRGYLRFRIQGRTEHLLAPGLFHLLRLPRTPSRSNLFLQGRSPVLRETPRRNHKATMFRLRWGKLVFCFMIDIKCENVVVMGLLFRLLFIYYSVTWND